MEEYIRRIRDLREQNHLNQKDAAGILGLTQQYYSMYENGKYEIPMRHLLALAEYYKVSLDYIMGRTKSRQNIDALNQNVTADCSVGELVTDVLGLDETGRVAVMEFVRYQKSKQKPQQR